MSTILSRSVLWYTSCSKLSSKMMAPPSIQLRSETALAGRLDKVLSRVFGAPPRPKSTKGRMVIQSKTKAARIFVNGKYAGSGKIRLSRKEALEAAAL